MMSKVGFRRQKDKIFDIFKNGDFGPKPFSNDDFAPSNSKIFSADAEAPPPSATHSPPHPPGLCSAFFVGGPLRQQRKF